MKILIVFSSNDIGGAEKSLTRMCHFSIMNFGSNFTLASIGGKGEWSSWVKSLNIDCITTEPGRSSIKDMICIAKYIKKSNFDIIYTIGLRLSLFVRFLKFILKMKYVLIHGIRWVPSNNTKLDITTRFIEKWFNNLIDGYIVNSKATQKILEQKCVINSSKIFTIYNGLEKTKKNEDPKGIKRILTIANLSPRKGYIEYLSVIKKVIEKHPNVKFVFIGTDNMKGKVFDEIKKNDLSNNIEYLGFVNDIKEELMKSYLFVLPSLHSEGCPTSIMEAMSYSLPCIAYDICGNNELIVNGKTGYLVENKNSHMLASQICNLIEKKYLRDKMAKESELRIKKYFSLEDCAVNHIKTFNSLITKKAF